MDGIYTVTVQIRTGRDKKRTPQAAWVLLKPANGGSQLFPIPIAQAQAMRGAGIPTREWQAAEV